MAPRHSRGALMLQFWLLKPPSDPRAGAPTPEIMKLSATRCCRAHKQSPATRLRSSQCPCRDCAAGNRQDEIETGIST